MPHNPVSSHIVFFIIQNAVAIICINEKHCLIYESRECKKNMVALDRCMKYVAYYTPKSFYKNNNKTKKKYLSV
jgi:hypothetical protein